MLKMIGGAAAVGGVGIVGLSTVATEGVSAETEFMFEDETITLTPTREVNSAIIQGHGRTYANETDDTTLRYFDWRAEYRCPAEDVVVTVTREGPIDRENEKVGENRYQIHFEHQVDLLAETSFTESDFEPPRGEAVSYDFDAVVTTRVYEEEGADPAATATARDSATLTVEREELDSDDDDNSSGGGDGSDGSGDGDGDGDGDEGSSETPSAGIIAGAVFSVE